MTIACIPALSFGFNLKHVKIVKSFTGFNAEEMNKDYFDYDYPHILANRINDAKNSVSNKKFASDPYDTHIKSNLEMIPLSIEFNKIYPSSTINIIGYTPQGGWEDDKHGWSGIVEFFELKDVGICDYGKQKIKSMEMLDNVIKDNVNKKLTTTNIQGKPDKGYLYSIEWYEEDKNDQLYENTVECENDKNDPNILNKITALACKIDSGN